MNRIVFYDFLDNSVQDCFHDIANSLTILSGALERIEGDDGIYEKELEYARNTMTEYRSLFLLFFRSKKEKKVSVINFIENFIKAHYPHVQIEKEGGDVYSEIIFSPSVLLFFMKKILFLFPVNSDNLKFKIIKNSQKLQLEVCSCSRIVKDHFCKKQEELEADLLKKCIYFMSGDIKFSQIKTDKLLTVSFFL